MHLWNYKYLMIFFVFLLHCQKNIGKITVIIVLCGNNDQWVNWQSSFPKSTKWFSVHCAQVKLAAENYYVNCKYNQYNHSKRNSRWHNNVPVHRYRNELRRSYQLSNWILKLTWFARHTTARSNIEI